MQSGSPYAGSSAEAWTSRKALAGDPELRFLLDQYEAGKKIPPGPLVLYNAMIAPLAP